MRSNRIPDLILEDLLLKRFAFYLVGFVLGCVRYWWLLLLSIVLVFIGLAFSEICTYVGLGILGLCLLLALISAIRMRPFAGLVAEGNELSTLIEEKMQEAEAREKLHGDELLSLSNEELWETIFDQNMIICEAAEETEDELALFSGARRTVYIINTFDAEVQNGGLCQFFVNSSRYLAPYVSEALAAIGADHHKKLYDEFIETNRIDVTDLDSFAISSVRGFKKQAKRYDFEAFDDRYYEFEDMEDLIANYIRVNITEF
jgi:hypothetical protein